MEELKEKQLKKFLKYAEENKINLTDKKVYEPGSFMGFDNDKLVVDTHDGVFKIDKHMRIFKAEKDGKRILNTMVAR